MLVVGCIVVDDLRLVKKVGVGYRVDPGQIYGFCGMCRRVLVHIGYTIYHLPILSPALESREEASVASLAARMAFSSLLIRS